LKQEYLQEVNIDKCVDFLKHTMTELS